MHGVKRWTLSYLNKANVHLLLWQFSHIFLCSSSDVTQAHLSNSSSLNLKYTSIHLKIYKKLHFSASFLLQKIHTCSGIFMTTRVVRLIYLANIIQQNNDFYYSQNLKFVGNSNFFAKIRMWHVGAVHRWLGVFSL